MRVPFLSTALLARGLYHEPRYGAAYERKYGAGYVKFLPYQLSMVGYWPTMALTGDGELGFDSGEGA